MGKGIADLSADTSFNDNVRTARNTAPQAYSARKTSAAW